jgi:hypothetical protein
MSNHQHKPNPLSGFKSPYKTQRPELQAAFDSRPPLCAVWVTPQKKNRRNGLSYADVTLVRDDGLCFRARMAINPDTHVTFDQKLAEELVDDFRSLTGDRYLLFYNVVEGLKYLKYHVGPGKVAVCLKEAIAETFPEINGDPRRTTPFKEAMKRLGIPDVKEAWPEMSNGVRLLSAWYKCFEETLGKNNPPSNH